MSGSPAIRYTGLLNDLARVDRRALTQRALEGDASVVARTAAIVERVRLEGDGALRALAAEFDGVQLAALEVPRALWRAALRDMDPALRAALERAATNIARVHRTFIPQPCETESEPGIVVGRRPDPLARVGVYAPGGRAAYPSSVLMGVVPARVAGVAEVIVCSPPDTSGVPSAVVLAAAEIADADRVFAIGGAGAIAAMAYGTASVPPVDRIVGPGNAFVAAAKLQLSGVTTFDSPAGPSELLVIADERADAGFIAREVLAQAEHDPGTSVVVVLIAPARPEPVLDAIATSIIAQPRATIIREALASRGGVLIAESLDQAITFANDYAAEHLLLALADPDAALPRIRNAGTVFLGDTSSVAFGDYMTGANHVLPTGGRARSYSGLSTLDFVRWTTYQRVSAKAADGLASDVGLIATAEGLPAHAAASLALAARQ